MSTEQTSEKGSINDQSAEERMANANRIMEAMEGSTPGPQPEPEPEAQAPEPERQQQTAPSAEASTTMGTGTTRRKRGPRPQAPATRTPPLPARVKAIMGGDGERYRFYKVDQFGKNHLIRDYSAADLRNANNDIELFIQQYLLDDYGAGGYLIQAYDDKGSLLKESPYSIAGRKGASVGGLAGAGAAPIFEQTLVQKTQDQLAQLQERIRLEDEQAKRDLKEQNAKMQQQMAALQSGSEGSMSGMFMMMMQMQQQADARMDARMESERRRAELQMQMETARAAAAPPPMLPPPPPAAPDPFDMMMKFMTLQQAIAPKKDDTMERMLQERIRDLETRISQPREGIKDIFEKFEEVDQLVQRRYPVQEPSGGMEMLKGFLDNFQGNMAALRQVIVATPQQAASPDAPQLTPPADVLPEGFLEIITELDDAANDLERINVIMAAMQLFGNCGNPIYEGLAAQMVKSIAEGKKKPVMLRLEQILRECVNRKMCSEESAEATMNAIDEHFDAIRASVRGDSPPPQAPQQAEPAPVPAESEPANDDLVDVPETSEVEDVASA